MLDIDFGEQCWGFRGSTYPSWGGVSEYFTGDNSGEFQWYTPANGAYSPLLFFSPGQRASWSSSSPLVLHYIEITGWSGGAPCD